MQVDLLMNWINNMYILASVLKHLLTKCQSQSVDILSDTENCYVLKMTLSNLFHWMNFHSKSIKILLTPSIQLKIIQDSFRQVIDHELATSCYLY